MDNKWPKQYDFVAQPGKVDNDVYISPTGFNYTHLFFFEERFFDMKFVSDLQNFIDKYRAFGPALSFVYIIVIFTIKHLMRNREKFNLRGPLIAWNLLLAAFSIFGTCRIAPEFYHVISNYGLQYTLCRTDFLYGVSGHWGFLFSMSKIFELVDTLFIVLRKQPLIFLHWYHHATILAYCYYWYPEAPSTSPWFGGINYIVHSFMYSYYACKAMRIVMPKKLSVLITSLQLTQMMVGLWVCCYVLYKKQFDTEEYMCQTTYRNLKHSFIMYFSYFLLFLNFFIQAYVFGKKFNFSPSSKSSSTSIDSKKAN